MVLGAAALCGVAPWLWGVAWPSPAAVAADPAGKGPAYSYVGTKKCKSCHTDLYKSWAKTKMGTAFETLKPGQAREVKERFNLDVEKDYTTDPRCLKCHATGRGEPGGYVIPDPDSRTAVRKAKNLEGVGCESCHGPGSKYVELLEEIDEAQRPYRDEELRSAGLRKIEKAVCLVCHNEECPATRPDEPFDYEKIMRQEKTRAKGEAISIHIRKLLELREG
jgi:hypothetical protein